MNNIDLLAFYMMIARAYRQDSLHSAERQQPLAQSQPHWSMSRYAAGKLGIVLLKLGGWLKHFEQPSTTLPNHI